MAEMLAQSKAKKKAEEEARATSNASASTSARATPDQYNDPELRLTLFCLVQSYYKLTKKYLLEGVDLNDLPEALYNAPFCLLMHDRFQEGVTDPCFVFANRMALELWETTWPALVGQPSRLSALPEPEVQSDRQALLDAAAARGLITDYEGWRVSAQGSKFKLKGVTLFNVTDMEGEKMGQAAVFDHVELPDGGVVKLPGLTSADQVFAVAPVLTPGHVEAAQAEVTEQADYIRSLKEGHGLGNQDPRVQAAVKRLKMLKDQVAAMQRQLEGGKEEGA